MDEKKHRVQTKFTTLGDAPQPLNITFGDLSGENLFIDPQRFLIDGERNTIGDTMKKKVQYQKTLTGEVSMTKEDSFNQILNSSYKNLDENYVALTKIDWDFKLANTSYFSHNFHPYPARFIPQIPSAFIKLFTKENDIIIDPFCGCGTTLVEALLNKRNAIGNDLNPLACLISRAKVTVMPEKELNLLYKKIAEIKRFVDADHRRPEYLKKLPKRNVSNLFNRDLINEISLIKEYLEEIKDFKSLYELALAALSASIWTLIESGNGAEFFENFRRKISSMMTTISEMSTLIDWDSKIEVIEGDSRFLKIDSNISPLIVTSPPYVNALDYYRIHMYNMLWLGIDYLKFKKHEIGGHSHFIANRFRLLTEYLADMLRSMVEMNRVLKNGGHCVIVVGNSSVEYELIESYKHFLNFAPKLNFKPINTFFRNIDVTRKYSSKDVGKIDTEFIVLLRKTDDANVSSSDNNFVEEIVTKEMLNFSEKIKRSQGTSLRGKKVSKERLKRNIEKIKEAIEFIPNDIQIKEW